MKKLILLIVVVIATISISRASYDQEITITNGGDPVYKPDPLVTYKSIGPLHAYFTISADAWTTNTSHGYATATTALENQYGNTLEHVDAIGNSVTTISKVYDNRGGGDAVYGIRFTPSIYAETGYNSYVAGHVYW